MLALPSLALAQALPASTICVTMRMYAEGKSYPFPGVTDSEATEKLSKLGYRPAPCNSAQIRLSLEVRITGQTEETAQVTITADGKNGSRPGHYQTQIPAKQFAQTMAENVGRAMVTVMTEIDPDYTKRVMDAAGVRGQNSPNTTVSAKTVCTSYRMFMSDKEVNLPDEINHMEDGFFAETGYQPTTCDKAQIKLESEMRFTQSGTDAPIKIGFFVTGKSGQRTEKYQMDFTGDEWTKNRENVLAQMGLGMMVVMDKIEPGYMAKYGEWVGKQQLQAPPK